MLLRADEDNDDVIESFSLYYIFSVFPSFVYYYYATVGYRSIFHITNATNWKLKYGVTRIMAVAWVIILGPGLTLGLSYLYSTDLNYRFHDV